MSVLSHWSPCVWDMSSSLRPLRFSSQTLGGTSSDEAGDVILRVNALCHRMMQVSQHFLFQFQHFSFWSALFIHVCTLSVALRVRTGNARTSFQSSKCTRIVLVRVHAVHARTQLFAVHFIGTTNAFCSATPTRDFTQFFHSAVQ